MKTQLEIELKIAEHEAHINEILNDKGDWLPIQEDLINNYLMGRKALLWVLSPDELIFDDEYAETVKYELLVRESSKIF
jgi:hypothetical protein